MNPIWLNAIRASGAAKWWRAGGAPEPIAVYQPIGAASLAASYVNLVNPGTYDAAPGVAPTWASATGWGFNGTTQYLLTGVVPTDLLWTMIIRASNVVSGLGGSGYYTDPANMFFLRHNYTVGVSYGNGFQLNKMPGISAGVIAIAGKTAYRNGVNDGTVSAGGVANGGEIHVGRVNVANVYMTGNIQAIAIYPTDTDHAVWVPAVSAAAAALTG